VKVFVFVAAATAATWAGADLVFNFLRLHDSYWRLLLF
jgi:hypothetical protein